MARKLLYSMGEVAEMFDVKPSLLRHWESKFDILKPKKNRKGNRLFTPEDVENIRLIYHLVKERGMTLEGARRTLAGSHGGVSRDAELLERLLRIRAQLVEVREELKSDADDMVGGPDEEPMPDLFSGLGDAGSEDSAADDEADSVAEEEDLAAEEEEADSFVEEEDEPAADDEDDSAAEEEDEPASDDENELAAEADEETAPEDEDGSAVEDEGEPAAEGVMPLRMQRRRREHDPEAEAKELFAFYEQSLF